MHSDYIANSIFLYYLYRTHRDLHSFPTRRSSDLVVILDAANGHEIQRVTTDDSSAAPIWSPAGDAIAFLQTTSVVTRDRKSTRLNSSHANISYAVFCLKKKKRKKPSLSDYSEAQH